MNTRSYRQGLVLCKRSVRRVLLTGGMLVTVALGLVAPSAALADDCAPVETSVNYSSGSQNQRSIEMIEDRDPANFPASASIVFVPLSQNARSIELIEGKDPANVPEFAIEHPAPVGAPANSPRVSRTAL